MGHSDFFAYVYFLRHKYLITYRLFSVLALTYLSLLTLISQEIYGQTLTGNRLYLNNTNEDKISLYDNAFGQTYMYGFGIESSTLYHKSFANHRWYINSNADGGISSIMDLTNNGLAIKAVGANANNIKSLTSGDAILRLESDPGNETSKEANNPRLEMYQDGGLIGMKMGFNEDSPTTANIFQISMINSTGYDDIREALTINPYFGHVGLGILEPQSRLSVNGNIAISNAAIPMGLMTEIGGTTPLLNLGINFRAPGKNNTYLGAAFRIDSRIGQHPLFQWKFRMPGSSTDSNIMTLTKDGHLGIGTYNPSKNLEVFGIEGMRITRSSDSGDYMDIKVENNVILSPGASTVAGIITNRQLGHLFMDINANSSDDCFAIRTDTDFNGIVDKIAMVVRATGRVGIGTNNPQNELSVNGTIWAKKVKVQLVDGADWVFEEDYKLPSLEEVEAYIKKNKHLPGIPSAEEFKINDLDVAQMDNMLLQKIEELTLYMIDLKKENEKLKEELHELKNK